MIRIGKANMFSVLVGYLCAPVMSEEVFNLGEEIENDVLIVTSMRQDNEWIDSPFTVSLLESQKLEEKLVRNLTESLSTVPGVMVQKTANGHGSPFLRGFTGYRTLALIDGVRYNNSVYRDGPNEYFSLIDLGAIERIELLHGPSSVVYGSDAIGGTLNLHTKETNYLDKEDSYSLAALSYRYSTAERSHQERVEAEIGNGGVWGLRLGISAKQYGDVKAADIGTQRHTGYEEISYDLRFDWLLSDQWEFSFVHQDLEQNDVWRTHSTIFGESFSGTTIGSDLRRLKDQKRTLTYSKIKGNDLNLYYADTAEITLSYQTWDEESERTRSDGERSVEFFDSAMAGVDVQFSKNIGAVDLVYGFDIYNDKVDSGRVDYNTDGSIGQVRVQGPIGDNSSYLQTGFYLQADWDINDRWSITGGSRFTYIKASIGSYEDPITGQAASYRDDWQTVVNSARVKYSITQDASWNAWVGISQSFRAPNIADLSRYGGSRSTELEVATTDIEPEKFLTFELGLKAERESYMLGATYYYTFIDNYISSTPTGRLTDGLTEVSKENSAEGYVQGVELDARYNITDEWAIWGNVTWLEGELDVFSTVGSNDPVSEPLSRIMPITINTGIEWRHADGNYWAGMDVQWAAKADKLSSGDESDTQRIPPDGTPSYIRVNLNSGYQLNENWGVNIAVNNLFNEAYRIHGSGNNEAGFGVNFGVKGTF